jgi:heptosyltransferase I
MNRKLYRYFPLTVSNPFLYYYLKIFPCFFFFVRKKNKKTQPIQKILLVQLAHLGDVALLKSYIPSIQAKYPKARFGVLIGSWSQEFFENFPEITLHILDHWKTNRSSGFFRKITTHIGSYFLAYQSIKQANYDMSIDISLFYPNSHILTWLTKIPERVGFFSGGCGELLTTKYFLEENILPIQDEIENLLKLLGVNQRLKPDNQPTENLWVFHPYSGNQKKDLSENFWRVLYLFFKAHGKEVVFTGRSNRENLSIQTILGKDASQKNLCGKLCLQELETLVSKVQGIICVDTGIAHIASIYHSRIFVQFNHPLHMIRWKPRNAYSLCHQQKKDHENNYSSRRLWNKTFRKDPKSS